MPNGGPHYITLTDAAAASDLGGLGITAPGYILTPDQAGAADVISVASTPALNDAGAAVDDTPAVALVVQQNLVPAAFDRAAAADGLGVTKGTAPAPVPMPAARIAAPVFILTAMPRMHLQNLVTGAWLSRDVQGISNPSVTWNLDQPDSFSCTVSPPRAALLDPTGNPLMQEWQTACYLEQNSEIKFGGILTASTYAGPAWSPTFTGFAGYASGIIYEGPNYSQVQIDALDVVRYLWAWVQAQPSGNIGLVLDSFKSGVLLGAQLQSSQFTQTTLARAVRAGDTTITVVDPTGFAVNTQVQIAGSSSWRGVSKISKNVFTLSSAINNAYGNGSSVVQGGPGSTVPTPFVLDWWNSTDIGQEIGNIATEAIFDWWEQHAWTDAAHSGVKHMLHFGVPRIGTRQATLRFAEGENIVQPVQTSRDGSVYANEIIGLGCGQGSLQLRAQVATPNGRLRRVFTYTDQTMRTQARLQSRAQQILASRIAIDTPASVVVRNHPNAPFGTFRPGDDILVTQAQGWRACQTWCRITSMTQDPTTNLMTLTCARSDSFTYLAQSGQAGTL